MAWSPIIDKKVQLVIWILAAVSRWQIREYARFKVGRILKEFVIAVRLVVSYKYLSHYENPKLMMDNYTFF